MVTMVEEHKQHGAGGRDATILQSVGHSRTKMNQTLSAHLSNVSEVMYMFINNTEYLFKRSKKSSNLGGDFGVGA